MNHSKDPVENRRCASKDEEGGFKRIHPILHTKKRRVSQKDNDGRKTNINNVFWVIVVWDSVLWVSVLWVSVLWVSVLWNNALWVDLPIHASKAEGGIKRMHFFLQKKRSQSEGQ